MADTRVQVEVEDWVRRNWLSKKYGQQFHRERVALEWGGVFDFDAVSSDGSRVAAISTSAGKTASGKLAVGQLMKMRSDVLFLLHAKTQYRVMVFTELDMFQAAQQEREAGRLPKSIDFTRAEIPPELEIRLREARKKASQEVTPAAVDSTRDT